MPKRGELNARIRLRVRNEQNSKAELNRKVPKSIEGVGQSRGSTVRQPTLAEVRRTETWEEFNARIRQKVRNDQNREAELDRRAPKPVEGKVQPPAQTVRQTVLTVRRQPIRPAPEAVRTERKEFPELMECDYHKLSTDEKAVRFYRGRPQPPRQMQPLAPIPLRPPQPQQRFKSPEEVRQ